MTQRTARTTDRSAAMLVAACGACLLLVFWPRCAPAQRLAPNPFGSAGQDERLLSDIFLAPRYETRRRLNQAKSLLEQRRYGEAVTQLDRLLTQGEDYFLTGAEHRTKDGESPPRLKSEALRLIGQMPPKGLQWYELQRGAAARAMLDRSQKQGDLPSLRSASGRYFHTAAGYEATLLLARRHLDRNRPLAAAMCYQRLIASPGRARYEPALSVSLAASLLRAGHHDDLAQKALRDVKKNFPDAKLELAGRRIAWFAADDDPLAWLSATLGPQQQRRDRAAAQWNFFGGNPSRNATSRGGTPLRSWRWKVPTSVSPVVAERIEKLQRAYADRRYIALPSFHPLAVGDTVLMRTASHLVAVDLKTGKRLWPKQPALEVATGESNSSPSSYIRAGTSQFMHNLDRRMWNDAIYGRLASDGRLLFAVRKLAPLSDRQAPQIGIGPGGRRIILAQGPNTHNQLEAYELSTEGKLKWSVGGPPLIDGDNGKKDDDAETLAGTFFLGAPLPLKGRLYVLAEMAAKREIRLLVLNADTGKLLWSQQLAMAEWSVLRDPTRRAAGASPSYSNGLLICPTTAGAVVAVDLSTRRLKWGYRYPRNPRSQYTSVGRVNALEQGESGDVGDGWADSSALLVDGYVLVTPADNYTPGTRSGQIHCLNLIDGKRIWKRNRNKALYMACAADGKVILVGRSAVTALSIKDGTPHKDWPTAKKEENERADVTTRLTAQPLRAFVKLPKDALASGRGFLSGGHYFLPLTSGEIVEIDLSNGKIVGRIRLRDGFVPGNLICYRDQIISQGADTLATFHQLEPSRRWAEKTLKDHPKDAAALLRRGRIHLEENKLDEAVADLAASLAEAPETEETRQLLVEAMLAKLVVDFEQGAPSAEKFVDRLRSLVETPEERVALWRRLAEGLAKTGKRIEAFETLLRLVDLDVPTDETTLEQIEPSLAARRGRWIQASLGQLRREASADERKAMEQTIAGRRPKTDAAADLRRFIDHFVDFDATDTVRRTLVERLAGATTLARRERLLRRLERSADPVQRRAAIADMAALLVEALRADEAAGYYARLGSDPELADEVCRNGKTGRELATALAKDSPVRRYLGSSAVWPRGTVTHDAKPLTGIRQPSLARSYRVRMRGAGGPFFTETSAFLNPNDRSLTARDAYGAQRWRLSLSAESISSRFGSSMVPLDSYGVARGHLLLFSSSNSIYAIDTLRASAQPGIRNAGNQTRSPAVLWRHERNEQIPGVAVGQGYQSGLSFGRYYGSRRLHRNVEAIGPLNEHGVCYQRVRELICVDPLTGQTQWVRRRLPRNCELFGDDELLFVVPPNGTRAQVLRAADGKLVGERNVPLKSKWIATVGRYLLTKQVADDGHWVFGMIDPWKEQDPQRWPPLKFAAGSRFTLVDHDALAVLEPDGRFTIHALADRRVLVEARLKEEAVDEVLQAVHVMPSRDRYLLVVDRPLRRAAGNVRVTTAPSASDVNMKMVNARVYAFDRAGGKPLWPAPARIDRYGLLLHQPRELPVFVVARHVKISGKPARSELLCLDKRSGRLVYRSSKLTKPITNYTIVGDPSQRAVSLNIHSGEKPTITRIVFSDEPTAPDPPYQGNQSGGPRSKPPQKFGGAGDDPFSEEGSDKPFPDEEPEDDD